MLNEVKHLVAEEAGFSRRDRFASLRMTIESLFSL
jgi:hypothetical protein